MALRHLSLRDFVIVPALDLALGAGFSALTGETGAGKSILIDALQLALGGRGDALWVREGQPRCEIGAEFDTPASAQPWLAPWPTIITIWWSSVRTICPCCVQPRQWARWVVGLPLPRANEFWPNCPCPWPV